MNTIRQRVFQKYPNANIVYGTGPHQEEKN